MKTIIRVISIQFMVMVTLCPPVCANGEGIDPLIKHIITDQAGEVALYLEGDNSPDVRDNRGNPALVVAVAHNRLQIVKLLLEAKANPNLNNATGMTALMMAANKQHYNIIQTLLEHGANVNLQNPQTGYTALMYAVEKNDSRAIELLLAAQAEVNIKNYSNMNALEIAQARGYTNLLQLLLFNNWNLPNPPNIETTAPTAQTMAPAVIEPQVPHPPSDSTEISAEVVEYIGKADYLLNQDHIKLARDVLKDGYQATGKITLLLKWFEVDERLFNQLKIKNNKHMLTQRTPASTFQQSWNLWSNRQRQIEHEINNPIQVLPLQAVDQVLKDYEQLKASLLALGEILQQKIRTTTSDTLRQYEDLFNKYNTMVDDVKRTRYKYISFDVISPYLARAEQQVFLSENAYYFAISYSPEIFQQAAKTLAKAAHQEIIFETASSVREQFFSVYKTFMATAGSTATDLEEFVIIQVIKDKLVKSPSTNPRVWWQ